MNKFQKEFLEKCIEVKISDETPLFDDVYILPTNRKHDSGYKIMNVVGLDRKENKYYLLDTYCDVVNFGEFESSVKDLNVDILENGIIHYWSNYKKFRSCFRVSSCTFEMIKREKSLWEELTTDDKN